MVDEHVRQRRVELVHAVHAEQPRDRTLDRDGRLAGDLLADLSGDLRRGRPAVGDESRVEVELGGHAMSFTMGKGMTSRKVSRSVRIMTSRSTPIPPPAVGE